MGHENTRNKRGSGTGAAAGRTLSRRLGAVTLPPFAQARRSGKGCMVKIVYVEPAGRLREVEVKDGWSAMEGAVRNGVEGIVAECGGTCSCATCHVYVDEPTYARLPPPDDIESAMLAATAAERRPTSRLSCQIRASESIAGIRLQIPERQY